MPSLASARSELTRVEPGATASAISPLPIVALRLAPSALSAAKRFGFETVADLLPVARGPLARRLGLPAITRLDQALGAVAEPITPREDAEYRSSSVASLSRSARPRRSNRSWAIC
ncbi:hypothetical protein [Sphingomonas sp. LK11]|uniref:hypothetical protein n=1 Tax=Sphingomonas sp. LK11 TaxID=1390395 RepID=UPI001F1E0CCC|nr:hypothetical protein [Sphingomonas sp. LK11]